MKNRCIWLVLMLCLAGGSLALSAQSRGKRASRAGTAAAFSIPSETVHVTCSLQKAPSYAVDSKKVRTGSGATGGYAREWLVNEISFQFSLPVSVKDATPVLLTNMKVELYLYVPGSTASGARWLYGSQVLHGVVVDPSRKPMRYWVSLFMPPSYVYAYFPQDRNGKYNLKQMEGVVLFSDKDGVLLGQSAFSIRGKVASKRARQLFSAVSALRQSGKMAVMLWPREKTPWQWLDADRFELSADEKSEVPKAAAAPKAVPADDGEGGGE